MSYVRLTTTALGTILTMYRTIDFSSEKEDTIPTKECKGRKQSFSESDVYKDMPKVYRIEARLTDSEKVTLYQIEGEGDTMALDDSNGAIESKVWLEEVECQYENVKDVDSPWHVTLTFVVVP